MGSAVDFEDIFAEAEGALPPVFPKDRYVQARAPADTQRAHPSGHSTLTSSHLFTLSIATVVFIAVYWIYSFLTDLRRRQRDSFFQLEHRRRHGIPDDDKRPWHEAYPAALERRRPHFRKPTVKEDIKPTLQYDSAYDPYGRTIKDHFILEENARVERQNVEEREEAARLGSPTKDGFYPGPLTISRARSSLAPDAGARGEKVSRSPSKHISSPHKSGVSSSSNRIQSGNHVESLVPSKLYAGSHGAPKTNGRKRLYMDPRDDEFGKAQSGGEGTDDERAGPFSLPKRQRVNTWGTDSHANATIPRIEKRPAEFPEEFASVKRQRQTFAAKQKQVAIPLQNKPLTASSSSAVPISRLKVKPTVTFAPTPRGSSSASSSVPSRATNGQLPGETPTAAASAARGQKREYEVLGAGGVREDASILHDSDSGQPAKRSREAVTNARQVSPKKTTSKVLPQARGNDEPQVAVDPLCIGHRPGEIWESGNMRFKVGPDGRRLRAGNVKERRPKYHMPADSAHQDHSATIEVVVEKWFTDEDYASAKAAGEFAWQDEPSAPPAKATSNRGKTARSSASFWDVPDSTQTSPCDSGSEVNPFALGSSGGRVGPVRARSSIGSPAPVPAGARRAASTRWQKQQAEAEALKRIQEAKAAQEKAKTRPSDASAPTTIPSVSPPVGVMPSFIPIISSQAKTVKPSTSAPDGEKAEDKDGAPKSKPFAGIGVSSSVPSTVPSSMANPFAPFPAPNAASASVEKVSPSASKPLFPPMTSTTPSAPSLFLGTSSAQPKPDNKPAIPSPFSFPSFGAPKIDGPVAPTTNPFAPRPVVGAPVTKMDAAPPTTSSAGTAPPLFAFGATAKPTSATSTPPQPTSSGFGASSIDFGGPTKSPVPTTSAPLVPSFGSGRAPSGFSFGPDAKRTESTSTVISPSTPADASQLSSATTLVGSATTPTTGFAPLESKDHAKSLPHPPEPAKTNAGSSLLDRLGPQPPAAQTTAAPSPFSAFPARSAPPVSVFGTSVPQTSAAPPNPFVKPVFGSKPEQPAQGSQGISLKGAATAFGAPAAINGTSNGASGGFSFNKTWTNPDLAKKADEQQNGGTVFGAGASKPNIFQTGPTEPVATGAGTINTTADAAPRPPSVFGSSVFRTQPSPFGAAPAAPGIVTNTEAGNAPTPDKWVPPTPGPIPFSPQPTLFPAHRPTGATGARARSRSSRPHTRPPR